MSELFDLSEQYTEMLERGLRLSGEDQDYFIEGRLRYLKALVGAHPRRILDFGCGNGHTAKFLAEAFPHAHIVGVDTAERAVEWANAKWGSERVSFQPVRLTAADGTFDVCYTNGVFHHIEPAQRLDALRVIREALKPGGLLALFENNPWNLGTRMVMRRIPFDRDAKPVSPIEGLQLLRRGGFGTASVRSLFYFPHALAWLRFAEPWLAGLPLGAQYCVAATKR